MATIFILPSVGTLPDTTELAILSSCPDAERPLGSRYAEPRRGIEQRQMDLHFNRLITTDGNLGALRTRLSYQWLADMAGYSFQGLCHTWSVVKSRSRRTPAIRARRGNFDQVKEAATCRVVTPLLPVRSRPLKIRSQAPAIVPGSIGRRSSVLPRSGFARLPFIRVVREQRQVLALRLVGGTHLG